MERNNLKKILLLLLVLSLSCFILTGCNDGEKEENNDASENDNAEENNGNSDDSSEDTNTDADNQENGDNLQKLYTHLPVGEDKALVILEVDEVIDGLYTRREHNAAMIVKCSVVKDYYNVISPGTEIYVPIRFYVGEGNVFEPQLRAFVTEGDRVFAHLTLLGIKDHVFTDSDNNPVIFEETFFAKGSYPYDYKFIPISNGKLNVSSVDTLIVLAGFNAQQQRDFLGFDNYFYDGMTEDALDQIAEKLYSDQTAN